MENEFSDEEQQESWPRFWVVEATDPEGYPLNKIIAPVVEKFFRSISIEIKLKRIRMGNLLVECTQKWQTDQVSKITKIVECPVRASVHKSLNSTKGIARSPEFKHAEETEILEDLAKQGVIHVKKMTVKVDKELRPTNAVLLTFNKTKAPESVKFGFVNVKVDLYVPNPLRCFNCQQYGHGAKHCKGKATCANCGQTGHTENCPNPKKCIHCNGKHNANFRDCPTWVLEKNIQKEIAINRIPYREARQRAIAAQPKTLPQGTYASKVVQTASVETQTDEFLISVVEQIWNNSKQSTVSAITPDGAPGSSGSSTTQINSGMVDHQVVRSDHRPPIPEKPVSLAGTRQPSQPDKAETSHAPDQPPLEERMETDAAAKQDPGPQHSRPPKINRKQGKSLGKSIPPSDIPLNDDSSVE